ncbi:acidic phospholipase A2 [Strongylocentrotus purpuratus]|uniref:Phospholipase A2 n=1 Tax=Strongylocentrotus purpuratus TaxID=7668 RepID=A0A7M7G450_STRPU|nr:acidic phospholipase A2 [Strongylocentrotus purpuratus]|eukprot:XP_001197473.1 PREDICTED: basic phospholipase A2 nigroxin A [Strongylocentrotus purpuratus]
MACIHLIGFLLLAAHTIAGAVLYDKTSQSDDVTHMVNDRALVFLGNMMSCTTNRTFLETLVDFGFYGCYCGFGGFGKPVDGVDRCCQTHDKCYEATNLIEGGVCYLTITAYIAPYKYNLHQCDTEDAHITCAGIDKYYWYDFLPKCSVAICKCDRDLAMCIARQPFHKKNRFHNRLKCFGEDVKEQARP